MASRLNGFAHGGSDRCRCGFGGRSQRITVVFAPPAKEKKAYATSAARDGDGTAGVLFSKENPATAPATAVRLYAGALSHLLSPTPQLRFPDIRSGRAWPSFGADPIVMPVATEDQLLVNLTARLWPAKLSPSGGQLFCARARVAHHGHSRVLFVPDQNRGRSAAGRSGRNA